MSRHPRESAAARGYDAAWQRFRRGYLVAHPLCVLCREVGRVTPATVVDHIVPMRQGGGKYDPANLRALCKPCHDGPVQAANKTGKRLKGCDVDGWPLA